MLKFVCRESNIFVIITVTNCYLYHEYKRCNLDNRRILTHREAGDPPTMGELISKQSDHREPSTESLANLAGIGRSIIF